MGRRKKVSVEMKYLAVVLGIFGLEFYVKNKVEKEMAEGEERPFLKHTMRIRRYHNSGAFLDVGHTVPGAVLVLSVLLTLFMTVVFAVSLGMAGMERLKWGLSLLLGGAFSNTYDRLFRKYVVDYVSLNVPFKALRRIVFNLSDLCIVLGTLLAAAGYGVGGGER